MSKGETSATKCFPVCYAKAVYTLDPASSRAASGSDCSGLSSHAVLPEIMCSGDIS